MYVLSISISMVLFYSVYFVNYLYVIDEFMNFILQVHVFDMTESKVLNMHCFIGLELRLCYCRFLIWCEELISV